MPFRVRVKVHKSEIRNGRTETKLSRCVQLHCSDKFIIVLQKSYETKLPVRLFRGPDGSPVYSPQEGWDFSWIIAHNHIDFIYRYRYDGLYEVINVRTPLISSIFIIWYIGTRKAEDRKGSQDFWVCMFDLQVRFVLNYDVYPVQTYPVPALSWTSTPSECIHACYMVESPSKSQR